MPNPNIDFNKLPDPEKMEKTRGPQGIDEVHSKDAIEAQQEAHAAMPKIQHGINELDIAVQNQGDAVRNAVALTAGIAPPAVQAPSERAAKLKTIFDETRLGDWFTVPDIVATRDEDALIAQMNVCWSIRLRLLAERKWLARYHPDNTNLIDRIDQQLKEEAENILTLQRWHRDLMFDAPLLDRSKAT